MSETRVFAIASDTVTRKEDDGSNGQGCGNSKHLYAGRAGSSGSSRNYQSYLKFTLDFSGMAKIVSATLNLYNDEGDTIGTASEPGIMGLPSSSDHPEIWVYRIGDSFTEGTNADGHFDSSDYTTAAPSGTGVHKVMTKGANLLNTINITDIVKAWAPTSVAGGGKKTNFGIVIRGSTDMAENWSGWAQEHGNAAERPSITVVYELGPTKPNAPANLTPVGSVPSIDTFEGDFSDIRPTDKLQSALVQVFDGGVACTISTNNRVAKSGHGLAVNDLIFFTSLTGGAGLLPFTGYKVRAVIDSSHFTLKLGAAGASTAEIDITNDYSAATYSKLVAQLSKTATESERVADHYIVDRPDTLKFTVGQTYRQRARYTDNEGQNSDFTGLVSFSLSNTAPNPPTLSPLSGASYTTLNLVKFTGGPFSDPDAGDHLMAHQVQLSAYPPGDPGWDEADNIAWDSGKSYDPFDATDWTEYYGGRALTAGTYYWRARQWDQRDGASNWTYATIVLTQDFSPDPGTYDNVQIDPQAPWRIIIRDLYQADGVTKTVGRAPGRVVAVLEEAKNVGASVVYNSPGEIHFTLLKDDEQIDVIEPKQTHYALEFYSGDGWQEKYAGVVWDADATETDVVFKGIDYLALYDTVIDERYDPLKPDKSYKKNGSYYEQVTIRNVILDQLNNAKKQTDSWVGFISIGAIATMGEKVSVYSTMQPTLSFVAGLIDSHRQGSGKRTRIKVVKTTTGGYQLQIVDNPGVTRSDLAMYYGELVQGYRIIFFGDNWANVQHVIGRNRDGVKVVYKTIKGQPFQPATSLFGRIATVAVMDGVQDQNDLNRRGLQAAIQSAKLGKNVAIGIRTEQMPVLQGYDICDVFPLNITDGAVNTDNFGSGFWTSAAVAWEATDIGQQSVVITFLPREDSTSPDPDLIDSKPVSTQPEWQLGWAPPDPLKATSKWWVDQTTGKVYERNEETATLVPVTGTP